MACELSIRIPAEAVPADVLAEAADPGRVAVIRWTGVAILAFGLAVIVLRWWRGRR